MGLIIALAVILLTIKLIINKYSPKVVLIFCGFLLLFLSSVFGLYDKSLLPNDYSYPGAYFMMMFDLAIAVFSDTLAKIGLTIMCVSAYAKYMEHIGASAALVKILSKPLLRFNRPYVILAGTWILGMFMGLCFTAPVGLAIMLMVTMYPVLISLGISKPSAAAVIASTLCIDWSPAEPGMDTIANIAGMDRVFIWLNYKLPLVLMTMLVVAPLIYYLQMRWDKIENRIDFLDNTAEDETIEKQAPNYFAILPFLPLIIVFCFNDLTISFVEINLMSAVFISMFIVFYAEIFSGIKIKDAVQGRDIFFSAMGAQVAPVIVPIVAGQVFAKGILLTGAIDTIVDTFNRLGLGFVPMILMISLVILFLSMLMGTGNASFFGFAGLAPILAQATDTHVIFYLLAMHFSSSIGRTLSPISPVMLACSGMSDISSFSLVKRMMIPLLAAFIIVIGGTLTICRFVPPPDEKAIQSETTQQVPINIFPQSMRNHSRNK